MTNGEYFERLRERAEEKARMHSDAVIERNGPSFQVKYDWREEHQLYWYGSFIVMEDQEVRVINHSSPTK